MPQNYIIINEDKREYIHPYTFDDGAMFECFGYGRNATLTGLAFLLTYHQNNGLGGGDWKTNNGIIMGRWARDRIRIIGDQASRELFEEVLKNWVDISSMVLQDITEDNPWIRKRQEKGLISIEERVNG
jgi:hypothetical protein